MDIVRLTTVGLDDWFNYDGQLDDDAVSALIARYSARLESMLESEGVAASSSPYELTDQFVRVVDRSPEALDRLIFELRETVNNETHDWSE